MIFVRIVLVYAIVFHRARQPPRQRVVVGRSGDKGLDSHLTHQVASQLLRALVAHAQTGQARSARSHGAKQLTQAIGITIGDVDQLMGQHADHAFVGGQAGKKNGAEGDGMRALEIDRCIIAGIYVGLDPAHRLNASDRTIDSRQVRWRTIDSVGDRELAQRGDDQILGHRQETLRLFRAMDHFRGVQRQ